MYESESENEYEKEEVEVDEEGYQVIPQAQQAQPVQPVKQSQSAQLEEKKKEFDGSISMRGGWLKCCFCDKYHPNSMHLPGLGYCGHCWGWLNGEQLKLSEGVYTGTPNTIGEIKTFLKLTYPLHPKSCTNTECVYNKIITYKNAGTLHMDLSVELGFVKKPDKSDETKLSDSMEKDKTKNKTQFGKSTNLRINFNSSSISI